MSFFFSNCREDDIGQLECCDVDDVDDDDVVVVVCQELWCILGVVVCDELGQVGIEIFQVLR